MIKGGSIFIGDIGFVLDYGVWYKFLGLQTQDVIGIKWRVWVNSSVLDWVCRIVTIYYITTVINNEEMLHNGDYLDQQNIVNAWLHIKNINILKNWHSVIPMAGGRCQVSALSLKQCDRWWVSVKFRYRCHPSIVSVCVLCVSCKCQLFCISPRSEIVL